MSSDAPIVLFTLAAIQNQGFGPLFVIPIHVAARGIAYAEEDRLKHSDKQGATVAVVAVNEPRHILLNQ